MSELSPELEAQIKIRGEAFFAEFAEKFPEVAPNDGAFKSHVTAVLSDVLAELRIARDSTKGSLAEQVAYELRRAGRSDSEDALDRALTWYIIVGKSGLPAYSFPDRDGGKLLGQCAFMNTPHSSWPDQPYRVLTLSPKLAAGRSTAQEPVRWAVSDRYGHFRGSKRDRIYDDEETARREAIAHTALFPTAGPYTVQPLYLHPSPAVPEPAPETTT